MQPSLDITTAALLYTIHVCLLPLLSGLLVLVIPAATSTVCCTG